MTAASATAVWTIVVALAWISLTISGGESCEEGSILCFGYGTVFVIVGAVAAPVWVVGMLFIRAWFGGDKPPDA